MDKRNAKCCRYHTYLTNVVKSILDVIIAPAVEYIQMLEHCICIYSYLTEPSEDTVLDFAGEGCFRDKLQVCS